MISGLWTAVSSCPPQCLPRRPFRDKLTRMSVSENTSLASTSTPRLHMEDVVARRATRPAVWWMTICAVLVGCRTAGDPAVKTVHDPGVTLSGALELVDGTPVPGAELEVRCGGISRTVRTDTRGRFVVSGIPEGRCRVVGSSTRVDRVVATNRNVLRGARRLLLKVPAARRFILRGGAKMDETLAAWTGVPDQARVARSRPRAWMPILHRGVPRGGEIKQVPLLDGRDRLVTLETPAQRNLVYLVSCGTAPDDVPGDLERLLGGRAASGLSVTLIATPACRTAPAPERYAVLRGSEEVLWALSARPGALVVVDRDGTVLHRGRDLEHTVSFLQRAWPPFSAVRQVSVLPARTVPAAAAARLLAQARTRSLTRQYAAAHGLVDRALRLAPGHAEAHRQRALLKAHLGDLSGALREVTWWRDAFGEESADDLLDEVQRIVGTDGTRRFAASR